MYLSTANAILSHHKKLMKWDQPILFQTANSIIDLAPAIGKHAHTPPDASNQPSQYSKFRYSKHETCYQFDPETYFGIESHEQLMKDVRSSLKGARFYNNRFVHRTSYSIQELTCSFHSLAQNETEYKADTFMKAGTKFELNKVKSNNLFFSNGQHQAQK